MAYGLQRERVLHWPFFRNQEYFDSCGCRNKEPSLVSFLGHRHIELLKREAIFLYCLVRALISEREQSNLLYSPHAIVNASKVYSLRIVAEIKALMLEYSSKRSLIVAINEGMDLRSYVWMTGQPSLTFEETSSRCRR